MKDIWDNISKDPEFQRYFPDIFSTRPPPAEYFWKVYSVKKKTEYNALMERKLNECQSKRHIIDENFVLTDESMKVFQKTNLNSNLDLLRKLNS